MNDLWFDPNLIATGVTDLSEVECLALLSTTTVGLIAFCDQDGQQLVPVNFAVANESIYFRTLPDGILSQLGLSVRDVAFGVDHHDDLDREGWNVTVKGVVSQVEDRATINLLSNFGRVHPWVGGIRPSVKRLSIDRIDGRRISRD